jgi:hypothetical protein
MNADQIRVISVNPRLKISGYSNGAILSAASFDVITG